MTRMQAMLYEAMHKFRKGDVPIAFIYASIYGVDSLTGASGHRTMQQRVAAHISRLNAKLKKEKIIPGNTKRTYKISKLS